MPCILFIYTINFKLVKHFIVCLCFFSQLFSIFYKKKILFVLFEFFCTIFHSLNNCSVYSIVFQTMKANTCSNSIGPKTSINNGPSFKAIYYYFWISAHRKCIDIFFDWDWISVNFSFLLAIESIRVCVFMFA